MNKEQTLEVRLATELLLALERESTHEDSSWYVLFVMPQHPDEAAVLRDQLIKLRAKYWPILTLPLAKDEQQSIEETRFFGALIQTVRIVKASQ